MNETMVLEVARSGVVITLIVAAPLLAASLIVGIAVSLLQVATSLQDSTLTFVPKIAATVLVLMIFGGWMIRTLVDFTRALLEAVPRVVS